jgi:hypothetical protein
MADTWDIPYEDTSFDVPLESPGSGYEPPAEFPPGSEEVTLDPNEVARETQKQIWGTPPDDKSKGVLDQISNTPSWYQSLIKQNFTKPGTNEIDWTKLVGAGAGLVGAYQAYQDAKTPPPPTGYQGGIPAYTAVQGRADEPVAGSRPGAGHQYFTGVKFTPTAGLPAAQAAIDAQVTDLNKLNTDNAKARIAAPTNDKTNIDYSDKGLGFYSPEEAATPGGLTSKNLQGGVDALSKSFMDEVIRKNDKLNPSGNFVDGVAPPPTQPVIQAAYGGIMGLAHGGKPTHPHGTYLRGDTDGMADKIPGTIDGVQPARLAHGEFVIPADVVSHLGNGNSDAGAKQLYKMMDRIRMARTGNPKQGKEINPSKFMPGGLASYAAGGALPEGTTGSESNLSNWAGPYVTDLLGKTQALTSAALEKPQFYQGELTAGPSELQNKAYDQAGTLTGQSFTNAGTAGSYMSPYMQNVVDIQKREAQRQSGIQGTQQQAQAAQAGAFGGSRDAIMRAERERNLGTQMNDIQAQGLQSAYQAAQNQYNTEQNKNLANISAMAGLGNTQQQTTQAGLTAAQQQFELQKADPYKQLQFQQSMLQNMPLQAQSYNTTTNPLAAAAAGASGANTLFKSIFGG